MNIRITVLITIDSDFIRKNNFHPDQYVLQVGVRDRGNGSRSKEPFGISVLKHPEDEDPAARYRNQRFQRVIVEIDPGLVVAALHAELPAYIEPDTNVRHRSSCRLRSWSARIPCRRNPSTGHTNT